MGKRNSKLVLSEEDVEELVKQTHFTKEEVNTCYREFLTDCPSGVLSKEEFCRIYSHVFPCGDPLDFASLVFSTLHSDRRREEEGERGGTRQRGGGVSFKEFLISLSAVAQGPLQTKLEWLFRLCDSNQDGHVTRREMQRVVDAIGKMVGGMDTTEGGADGEGSSDNTVRRVFELMDLDKDNRISLEDFLDGARKDSRIIETLCSYEGTLWQGTAPRPVAR